MDDDSNIQKKVERRFANDVMFNIPLWAMVATHLASWIYGMMLYSEYFNLYKEGNPAFRNKPTNWREDLAYFAGYSFFTGLTSTAGHELVHRREFYQKILGSIPYCTFYYSHFCTEHVSGHHKDIATKHDAVSHEKGTSFYYAIVRGICATHLNTWNRECERIRKYYLTRDSKEPSFYKYIVYNLMTAFFCLHVLITVAIYKIFGMGGLYFQFLHVLTGLFWAEAVNYIEHYGLARLQIGVDEDGREIYEAVDGFCSWNAPASTLTFKIQRHSDHHRHGFRPY